MKTFIRCLFVPALFAGVGILLHAQDAEKERTRGKVLLLKNGHAMEGDIEKIDAQMCIRRGASEVWVAADKTARLCEDWDDAFVYVRSLVKQDDASELVKLARWCHLHQLNGRALDQARMALEIQPSNSDAKQMIEMLERIKKSAPAKSVAATPVAIPKVPDSAPTVDLTAECSIAFTTRVQPILMNTCASCHATGIGGKFQLDRVNDNTQKAATQRNLAAVMAYIDLDRPAISPLLTRAITPHGNAPMPAIRDRGSKPFQTMQQWIEMTVARNPQLKDYAAAKKGTPVKREPEKTVVGTSNFASQAIATAQTDDRSLPPTNIPGAKASYDSANQTTPRSPQMQGDRYGADQFNRTFHPRR